MALPALLAWLLFHSLRGLPWLRRPWFRGCLVGAGTAAFVLSTVYAAALVWTNPIRQEDFLDTAAADAFTFHPATLLAALFLGGLAAWLERRLENAAEFPLGLLVGGTAVLATIALNSLVLIAGGITDFRALALVTWLIHLPLAVVEGFILGCTVGFLARVKPELVGLTPAEKDACLAEAVR
jgi:ABC-type Co2+ transport system permease subunit